MQRAMAEAAKHIVTCSRLNLHGGGKIYVNATWRDASFSITVLGYPHSWSCNVTEEEVEEKASHWDISVEEYLRNTRIHLSSQHPDRTYSFSSIADNRMQVMHFSQTPSFNSFSWTMENKERGVFMEDDLTFLRMYNTMAVMSNFLDTLLDVNSSLKVQNMRAEKRAQKATCRMAMRFHATEHFAQRKRFAGMRAPSYDFNKKIEGMYTEGQTKNPVPKLSSSPLNYKPLHSLKYQMYCPNINSTSLDDEERAIQNVGFQESQLEPVPETETRTHLKSPNSVIYNPARHICEKEVHPLQSPRQNYNTDKYSTTNGAAFALPGGQNTCLDSHVAGANVAQGPSGHFSQSAAYGEPEYENMTMSKRRLAIGDAGQKSIAIEQNVQSVEVPLADDIVLVLNSSGTSHLKLPVRVDVSNEIDRGGPHALGTEEGSRSFEHGLEGSQVHTNVKTPGVNFAITKPSPPSMEVGVKDAGTLQRSPTCVKGVITLETKKTDTQTLGTGREKSGKSSGSGCPVSQKFSPASAKGGLSSVIVLSDSEEEECKDYKDSLVVDDEGRGFEGAMEGLLDEPRAFNGACQQKTVTQIIEEVSRAFHLKNTAGGSKKDLSWTNLSSYSKNLKVRGDAIPSNEEMRSLRPEREVGNWANNSGKRKERADVKPEAEAYRDGRSEGKVARNGGVETLSSWCERQAHVKTVTLGKIQRELTNQACRANGKVAEVEESEKKPVLSKVDKGPLPSTFDCESRGQGGDNTKWKNWAKEGLLWIKEDKSEVSMWEVPTAQQDVRNEDGFRKDSSAKTSSIMEALNMEAPPSLRKLEKKLDWIGLPKFKPEHSQLAENSGRNSGREMSMLRKQEAQDERVKDEREPFLQREEYRHIEEPRDSEIESEEYVLETGECSDDYGMPRANTIAEILREERARSRIQKKIGQKFFQEKDERGRKPSRRGRPPGKFPLGSFAIQGKNLHKYMKHELQSPTSGFSDSIYTRVDPDDNDTSLVPDSAYYNFDKEREAETVKPNQIWALYDEKDGMPRVWVHVKRVLYKPKFKAIVTWLELCNPSKQALDWKESSGYNVSCGDFKYDKMPQSARECDVNTINCFSHQMTYHRLTENVIQIYPQVGEVWALHHMDPRRQDIMDGANKKHVHPDGLDFRLLVILSECGKESAPRIQVLQKRKGFRTVWVPAYDSGVLSSEYMELFSHRVPAYKLVGKECPNLPATECWDIDAAAVPPGQSYMT